MQIFVSGVWKEDKARPYSALGFKLGMLIAQAGFDLACGPGTGIARYVVDGYRSIEPRGVVRFYLPELEEMTKIGEIVGLGADEVIDTGLDYPMRNVYQVKQSSALFILTGGDGTLEEAIAALAEYRIPVAALQGAGTAVIALERLVEIYPIWGELLFIHEDVDVLFERLRASLNT